MRRKWVTSDLHLNHKNILQFEQYCLRKNGIIVNSVEEYDNLIIERINAKVGEHDILYILGDFAFGGLNHIKEYLSRINGEKILIFGNHDKYSVTQAISAGFADAIHGPIYYPGSNGKVLLSHQPPKEGENNPFISLCLHGHLHTSKLSLDNFYNVNIAMNNYYPIDIDKLIQDRGTKAIPRYEQWLKEWYTPYEIFLDKNRTDLNLDEDGKLII